MVTDEKMTLTFDLWPWNSTRFVRLSRYMFVQNIIKLSVVMRYRANKEKTDKKLQSVATAQTVINSKSVCHQQTSLTACHTVLPATWHNHKLYTGSNLPKWSNVFHFDRLVIFFYTFSLYFMFVCLLKVIFSQHQLLYCIQCVVFCCHLLTYSVDD